MRYRELITENSKMEKVAAGMGLSYYQNDDIILSGMGRSGNSSAGQTRMKYIILDVRGVGPEVTIGQKEFDELRVGFVEIFEEDGSGDIIGLVNIELPVANRRGGIGKLVLVALRDTAKGPLKIFDIQPKAISYWNKIGTTFYKDSRFENKFDKVPLSLLKKKAKFGLYGIL